MYKLRYFYILSLYMSIPNDKITTNVYVAPPLSSWFVSPSKTNTKKQDPCKEKSEKQLELKSLTKEFRNKVKECEESLYGLFIQKYFKNIDGTQLTHYELLKGLFNYYKDEKTKDINFMLTFQQFIDKFPRDQAVSNTNFKKQHIFEAICRLLLLYDYDKGELGYEKTFFDRLENIMKGTDKQIDPGFILTTNVNESSAGGIVDILFKTNISIKAEEEKKLSACEIIYNKQELAEKSEEKIPTIIMIQNKYFDKEKTNIDKYDVTRMHALAGDENVKKLGKHKIILMVNNEEVLSANLVKSKQQFKDVIHKIYGVVQIDKWFQDMLYDLFKNENMDSYITYINKKQGIENKDKPIMTTRFHQLLITKSTVRYNNEQGIKKFIWGAVPRSGKSFMVADLVDKRKKTGNDVVIILGAKTETEQQFIEMFRDYSNFNDYAIRTPDKIFGNESGSKNIYILSQEWFKSGKIKLVKNKKTHEEYYTFDTKKIKFLEPLIKKDKKIDIFFDEIHKGGSTDNSSSILNSFIRSKMIIDIFVMVTATFAKPTTKYDETFMDSSPTKIIEWSYNDQQNMKQVINETKKQMMINSRNNIEKEVIEELFDDYQTRYGLQYLSVLTSEYEKYPELVLITPQILNPDEQLFPNHMNDVRNIFMNNLKCDACKSGQKLDFYKKPEYIFKQEGPVDDLLNYIGDKIYNSFQTKFNYPISSSHTELWFLPDKNLYHDDCSDICKKIVEAHQEEEDMQGGALGDDSEQDEVEQEEQEEVEQDEQDGVEQDEEFEEDEEEKREKINKKNNSIPNIEPLTRGLAVKIIKHSKFERYNVFIVHNTDLKYLIKTKIFDGFANRIRLYDFKDKKTSLKDQIKLFEKETYKLGRSLIILTGAKLRLGISLTCADIAFNFDNIKSVDNNYQTMFRVLTERENPQMKKYGYYLDFNKDRSIEFLYEYSAVYGEKNSKKTLKESIEYLQTLLFSFNYNGLNLVTHNTKEELGMYNKLIDDLSLSSEKYVDYWTKNKNLVSLIQKGLNQSINKKELKKLGEALDLNTSKKPKKINISLKKGQNRKKLEKESTKYDDSKSEDYNNGHNDGYKKGYDKGYLDGAESDEHMVPKTSAKEDTEYDQGHEDGYHTGYAAGYNTRYDEEHYAEEELKEDPLVMDKIIEFLSNSIPSIISLLALFTQQNQLNCSSIEECLENSIKQIESFTELCKCSTIEGSNIVDCFLNSPKNIDEKYVIDNHVTLKENLITVLSIIKKEIQMNEILRQALELKFNIILKEMKEQKGALIIGMKSDEIKKLIEDNLTIKKEEKDKFGEVFTPPELINEMLDRLPPEVWSNPELKWLDPANGIGNFPMIVYERLIKELPSNYKNSKGDGYTDLPSKQKWILEHMLYMVEINPKNVKISKKIFGDNVNIVCGNFLTMDMKKEFGVEKFDIIIGNPPFQETFENQNKRVGGSSLWSKFINVSFLLINTNGFLLFITPCSWMTGGSNVQSGNILNGIFQKNTLLYLDIENCGKYFKGVKSTFSYYLIKKSFENTDFPCVVLYKKKLYKSIINQELFRSLSVIPKLFTQETINIIKKVENKDKNKFNFQRMYDLDTRLIKRYDAQGQYIVKHKVVDIRRSNYFQENCMSKHKVIISMPGYIKAEYDFESGCSDATLFQIVKDKEEAEYIISLLNNNLYQFIINNYRELTGLNNHKNINNLSYPSIKVKDIYKYFNLTPEEINIIENKDISSDSPSIESTPPTTHGGSIKKTDKTSIKKTDKKKDKNPIKKTNKKSILKKKVNTLKRYKKLKNKSLKKF
jgi:hypothetical protein